jgi:hypothetical protein
MVIIYLEENFVKRRLFHFLFFIFCDIVLRLKVEMSGSAKLPQKTENLIEI